MTEDRLQHFLPLTPKVFHILLSLAEGPRNGYQLGIEVEERSEGAIRMSPGTLYENLHRLDGRGFIREESPVGAERTDGRGQRYYALTDLGLQVLRAEVARLSADILRARSLPALGR